MITTEALCQLSLMLRGTPSDVKKIIPEATIGQLCKMCELWERSWKSERGLERSSKGPKCYHQRASKRRYQWKPRGLSWPELKKKPTVKQQKVKVEREHVTYDTGFPLPTTKNSQLTKRLRALVKNAGVDNGSGGICASDSDSLSEVSDSYSKHKKEILNNEKMYKKL